MSDRILRRRDQEEENASQEEEKTTSKKPFIDQFIRNAGEYKFLRKCDSKADGYLVYQKGNIIYNIIQFNLNIYLI